MEKKSLTELLLHGDPSGKRVRFKVAPIRAFNVKTKYSKDTTDIVEYADIEARISLLDPVLGLFKTKSEVATFTMYRPLFCMNWKEIESNKDLGVSDFIDRCHYFELEKKTKENDWDKAKSLLNDVEAKELK